MKLWLSIFALALNFIGYIPYIAGILRGNVKPHRVTWGIWSILTIVTAVNQVKNDGGYSSLFFISSAVLVGITFLLSLKYGQKGMSGIDKVCLVLALGLLVYWIGVKDTRISTLMAVIIDLIGAIPTVIKTYRQPETETYAQWVLASIAGFITMFTVPRLDWVLLLYPAYVFIADGTVALVKFISERKATQNEDRAR